MRPTRFIVAACALLFGMSALAANTSDVMPFKAVEKELPNGL